MENTPQPPETEPVQPNFTDTKKGGLGTVFGIIVIIILLALGGLYYFTKGIAQIPTYSGTEEDQAMMEMKEQSDSNAIADIEADAAATDFSELDALEADLESDFEAN